MDFINSLRSFVTSVQKENPKVIETILADITQDSSRLKWQLTPLVEAQTAIELAKDIKYYILDELQNRPELTDEEVKKMIFSELDKKIMSLPREMASTSVWSNTINHAKLLYYIKIKERWFAGNIF